MNHELAKTLTTALVQFIDRERPEGTMCCSNSECANLENAFNSENFTYIEGIVRWKLSRLTEFEQALNKLVSEEGGAFMSVQYTKEKAMTLLELARKELLSHADESNPAIEATANLERAVACGGYIPKWLEAEFNKRYFSGYNKGVEEGRRQVLNDELGKKHLEGYIKGRNDTMREVSDFIESHFNCENAKKGTPIIYNTQTGTSTGYKKEE